MKDFKIGEEYIMANRKTKLIVQIIFAVLFALLAVAFVVMEQFIAAIVFFVIAVVFVTLVELYYKSKQRETAKSKQILDGMKARREAAEQKEKSLLELQLSRYRSGEPFAEIPGEIILNAGESLFTILSASRVVTHKGIVGHTGGGGGLSLRVAKGLTVHSGKNESKYIRGNIDDSYDGKLFFTNHRLVFLAKQNGFECGLKDVSAVTSEYSSVDIHAKGKTYQIRIGNPSLVAEFVKTLCQESGKLE
jgi:hypothetical protein